MVKKIQCTCTLNINLHNNYICTCADFSNICGVHHVVFAIINTTYCKYLLLLCTIKIDLLIQPGYIGFISNFSVQIVPEWMTNTCQFLLVDDVT